MSDRLPPIDERRKILQNFLNQKAQDIRIEDAPKEKAGPSLIVQANADGSLKPAPLPSVESDLSFRAFPDQTFCKFTELKERPGFLALCLNTAAPETPDVLHQIALVKNRGVAELLCNAVNCLMQIQITQQQALASAQEEANDIACDIAPVGITTITPPETP